MGMMPPHAKPTPRLTGALRWAVVGTLGLVAAEFFGGWLGHSIALVSDAVHNLTDVPTLAISWLALRWAERPPTPEKTYGYHRAGVLAAFTNALLLILVALYILLEAYERLRHPVATHAMVMLGVGVAAFVVNGGITLAVASGRRDLNIRSVLIHNLGDAFSNLAIVAGALAIHTTGAGWVDPLIGFAIGLMVLWSSYGVLRQSTHILLEGLPQELNLEEVARTILRIAPVQEVHDVHIWTLGTDLHILSCHVRIPDMHIEESQKILDQINERLAGEFNITHTTIQFERAGPPRAAGYYMPAPLDQSTK
jgi:cobalt-zinc-cadmium efflux system protein